MDKDYYKLSINDTLKKLSSSVNGLSTKEVEKRQNKYGLNYVQYKKEKSIISIFFNSFKDSIIIILLISSVLSFFAGEKIDALAILLIVLIDIIIGTFEEYNAIKSSKALQSLIHINSKVLRDKREITIDSKELVPGDIVFLDTGDSIPADLRIIESNNLCVDESVLTGESIYVEKDNKTIKKNSRMCERKNTLYMGTSVMKGNCIGVVISTGQNTEIGNIASIVDQTVEEETPLTARVNIFSKQISTLIISLSIVISSVLFMKGYKGSQIFMCVVALAVSAMPEGLPLAFTMALTIGSKRMLKKNVVVKGLNSVEALGSCTVIASDKTGTLTVNEQTAKKIVLPNGEIFDVEGSGFDPKGDIIPVGDAKLDNLKNIIKCTYLNNDAILEKEKSNWIGVGDSIDIAFLSLGMKYGIDVSKIEKIEACPYECEKRFSSLIFKDSRKKIYTIKGSIEVVLSLCSSMIVNNKKVRISKKKILEQNEKLASEGYRVIAVASCDVDKDFDKTKIKGLSFLGLVAFIDPIRSGVKKSIDKCRNAGIKVVMITGDHPMTAFSIAKDLNLADYPNDIATGEDLDIVYEKGEIEFDNFVRNKTVFSRVTPIQKLKIVESFKRQGEFIAVTGDGVNDAPALKAANIGIAMGSGTDVAKEVSSMIIIDDDFSTIVSGIEEGRVAYSNIRKITYLLLSCGMSEILFFILSILFNMPIPLLAIQLLWVNIVTDGLQDLSLSFEKKEKNIMKERPRNPGDSLFDMELVQETIFSGLFIGLCVFALWFYLINILKLNVNFSRTCILVYMVFIQNIHVFNCKSEKNSLLNINPFKNVFIIFSVISAIILQIIFIKVPSLSVFLQVQNIETTIIFALFIMSIPILLIMELYKLIRYNNDI